MKYNFGEFFEKNIEKFNYSFISERLTATINGDLHALFGASRQIFIEKKNISG
jgi:hypothetical protein